LNGWRREGLQAGYPSVVYTRSFGGPGVGGCGGARGKGILVDVPPNRIPSQCEAVLPPEMLPLVSLSQEEIDRIAGAVPQGGGPIFRIFIPLGFRCKEGDFVFIICWRGKADGLFIAFCAGPLTVVLAVGLFFERLCKP